MGAIGKEARLRSGYLADEVHTVYLGGGTPSLAGDRQVAELLDSLRMHFRINGSAEITLEANPDDIDPPKLTAWRAMGINRLSIGVQSFFEEDLLWMNRAHNARQAKQSVQMAQDAGFSNITIDLIYGSPGLTDERWEQNIDTALALGVQHLSCYALTVEPRTALAHQIEQKKSADIDPDRQARHFEILVQRLAAAGFEHYEISNFAKPGYRSRHNSSYWQGEHYLGLGPSAHSFNGACRQWNIANNSLYLAALANNEVPSEEEHLTETQQVNEYIMTSLRTIEGVSLDHIASKWGQATAAKTRASADKHIRRGHAMLNGNTLHLAPAGKFLADGIAADLFLD